MEKGKISALQMAMLIYPTIIATAILSVPTITAKFAGNDSWISPIIASPIGILTIFIAVKLHNYYPGKTVIQYSEDILGKTIGKVISFFILFFYIEITGNIAKTYSEFIVSSFLSETPQIVIIVTMILLCACCVYAGLEVMARCAQFLFPLFVFPLLFSIIFLAKDFQIGNILPMFENGFKPAIKGAIAPASWYAEMFLITFLLPYLTNKKKGMKHSMLSIVGVVVTLSLVNIVAIFVLGVATPNKTYPLMNVIRFVNVGGFIENMEATVMAIWIAGAFIKLSVFYYAAALGTAQWLNLSSYRSVIWPLGILIVQFAYWGLPNSMVHNRILITDFPIYSTFIQILIPLLLLIIASARKPIQKDSYT